MTTESDAERLEKKVDTLLDVVNKIDKAQTSLVDRVDSDRRLTDQTIAFIQQAITRVESEITDEKHERIAQVDGVKGTLSRLAWALFSAFLALTASGLAFVLFRGKP